MVLYIHYKGEELKKLWSADDAIATLGPFQKNNTGTMIIQKRHFGVFFAD